MTFIKELEKYAELYDIPIMQQEGISYLCSFITNHKIKNVLEIGSAIGYSAIRMAQCSDNVHITTIERDEVRYQKARENIARCGLTERIDLIFADALELAITGCFDFIFIDAAKAQYIRFFEKFEPFLIQGGYILSDNLDFHGYVAHPENIESRNLRQLVKKIKRYIEFLETRTDYETTFLKLGDGIAISKKL